MNELFTSKDHEQILALKKLAEDFFYTSIPGPVSSNGILAGGVFTSWYRRETPNDYDIFFLDTPEVRDWRNSHQFREDRLFLRKTFSNYASNPHIKELFVPGATYFDNKSLETNCQFIFTDFKTREELINSFDYWHCRVSFMRQKDKEKEGTLYISPEAFEHIRKKTLKRTHSPHWSPQREKKFLERGWKHNTSFNPTVATTGQITVDSSGSISVANDGKLIPVSINASIDIQILNEIEKLEARKRAYALEKEPEKKIQEQQKSKTKTWLEEFTEKLKRPWDSY